MKSGSVASESPAVSDTHPSQPIVSVIIPAYNAQSTLKLCLESVKASTWADLEVVVVSDASTDLTDEVALENGVRVVRNEQQQGAAYCRNVGAEVSSGEILFFVDADVVLNPDAIEIAAAAVSRAGVDVVFGSYIAETRAPGFFSQFKNYQHHFTHQHGDLIQTSFWSGCGAISRRVFEKLEGFDVSLRACEDIEFGYALTSNGHAVHLLKDLRGEHLKRYSLGRLIRSDFLHRAIPWTRLIRAGRAEMGKLNTRPTGVWSVALTGILYLLAAAAIWYPVAALAAVAALAIWTWLNRALLGFIREQRGLLFAIGSAGGLLLHFSICGVGYIAGRAMAPYPAERMPAPRYAWSEQAEEIADTTEALAGARRSKNPMLAKGPGVR